MVWSELLCSVCWALMGPASQQHVVTHSSSSAKGLRINEEYLQPSVRDGRTVTELPCFTRRRRQQQLSSRSRYRWAPCAKNRGGMRVVRSARPLTAAAQCTTRLSCTCTPGAGCKAPLGLRCSQTACCGGPCGSLRGRGADRRRRVAALPARRAAPPRRRPGQLPGRAAGGSGGAGGFTCRLCMMAGPGWRMAHGCMVYTR
jgi:hypothetical protein